MLAIGESVAGYRIERLLGEGGMGTVYEATQLALGRRVALKVLHPSLRANADLVERLRREGRLQAAIDHPNIVGVYELVESDPDTFLVMRLVQGRTLADMLRHRELDAQAALALMRQVAAALDAAHAAGLVHRDIKPQNVLVDGDTAYIADFGLTRAGDATATTATGIAGTVAYLAPEVIRGETATAASDRYSFAAMLYECLCGETVHPREIDAAVLFAHATEPPPPISQRRPELPETLDPVLAEGLALEPGNRPATAAELVERTIAALGDDAVAALGPPPPSRVQAAVTDPPAARRREPAASSLRPRGALVAGGAVLIAAAAAASFAIGRNGRDVEPATLERVPAPAIAKGAVALGSKLEPGPSQVVGCPRPATPDACSFVQLKLPGATGAATRDGAVTAFSVRGAQGAMALAIARVKGRQGLLQAGRSQTVVASNRGPQRYEVNLPISRGDIVGLVLYPGATLGARKRAGATTSLHQPDLRGQTIPSERGPGHEVLVRAEYRPGAAPNVPEQLNGTTAAAAPKGKVLEKWNVALPSGPVRVELVELKDRIVIDQWVKDRRVARQVVPNAQVGGRSIGSGAGILDGAEFGEVGVEWLNPDGFAVSAYFGIAARNLEFYG